MLTPTRRKSAVLRQWLNPGRVFCLILIVFVLLPGAQAQPRRKVDLSTLVVIGDSLSAGVQNGSLLAEQQINGYASLVAGQAGADLPLPLIAFPGIPNVITSVSIGPPVMIQTAPGKSTGRIDPSLQPRNLAVPGATVSDALNARPTCVFDKFTIFTDSVLGLPQPCSGTGQPLSQIETAANLNPTTIFVWLGSEDTLRAAINGNSSLLTLPASFEIAFRDVLNSLDDKTGAKLVVANVPDVTRIPFFTPAPVAAGLFGVPVQLFLLTLGLGPGDLLTPDAFAAIESILLGQASPPLPSNVVLDATEIAAIRSATQAYNTAIANQAAAHGSLLVDVAGLYESIQVKGVVVGGQRLTGDFFGGIFSLDGIHPTNTGYALIANEFIRALNTSSSAGIPPLSLRQIQKSDPLVFPGIGRPPSALGTISPEIVESLRNVLGKKR
jgi:lysophospholipase L1-like esterase